jgi:hypothetical protein
MSKSTVTKRLGDDWDLDTMTPGDILLAVNSAMAAQLEADAHSREVSITITLPARAIKALKAFKHETFGVKFPIAEISCYEYLIHNNILACMGIPYEIIAR